LTDENVLHTALCMLAQGITVKTSMLVRRMRISYMQAAGILDRLENAGIISAHDPTWGRSIMFSKKQLIAITRSNEQLQRI
jgi:DNA segregation ATPase FtsK/SpoIIIE-like protein